MSALPARLQDLLDLLALVPDRSERIDLLISTADRFKDVPVEVAERPFSDQHKVPACESEAFAWAVRNDDDTLAFHFAVENPQGISAKAMAVILNESCSGAPLESVAAVRDDVVYAVFGHELSMGKSMGLMGMVAMVRHFAKKAMTA